MTVFLPPPDTNPYLRLLAAALGQCQVTVKTMPVVLNEQWLLGTKLSSASILHFHWPSYGYTDVDRNRMAEYVRVWEKVLACAKSKGCKIVWTAHNLYPHEQRHHDLEREGRQVLLNACDAVIVHCQAVVPLLRENFHVPAECVVIPHGHYCGIYGAPVESAAARRALGTPEAGTTYLFFGQLRPYKGLERLVRVFTSLSEQNATLLIAGAAVDAAFARRLLNESHKHKNMAVHPFHIPDSEVSLYLGAADLLVLPYTSVLTSGTAILAHSFGRPIVAPALGCLPEAVPEGTGWLYKNDSDDALRNALLSAAGPLAATTSEKCLRSALRYDWRGVGEKTAQLYTRLFPG